MSNMFCFQCEQTSGGKGCTVSGVCGKKPEVANDQDRLTTALISLARAAAGKITSSQTNQLMMEGLFTTVTNVNFDSPAIRVLTEKIQAETVRLGGTEWRLTLGPPMS